MRRIRLTHVLYKMDRIILAATGSSSLFGPCAATSGLGEARAFRPPSGHRGPRQLHAVGVLRWLPKDRVGSLPRRTGNNETYCGSGSRKTSGCEASWHRGSDKGRATDRLSDRRRRNRLAPGPEPFELVNALRQSRFQASPTVRGQRRGTRTRYADSAPAPRPTASIIFHAQ
jgi:hypothetical protein